METGLVYFGTHFLQGQLFANADAAVEAGVFQCYGGHAPQLEYTQEFVGGSHLLGLLVGLCKVYYHKLFGYRLPLRTDSFLQQPLCLRYVQSGPLKAGGTRYQCV